MIFLLRRRDLIRTKTEIDIKKYHKKNPLKTG
jgi:hypothetical protein